MEAIRLTLTSLNTFALRSFIFFYATRLPLTLNYSLLTVKTDFLSAYSVMDFSTPDIPHHFVLFLCLTFKCPTLHKFLLTSFSERSCCRWPCQWTNGSPYKALPVISDGQFFPLSPPDFPVPHLIFKLPAQLVLFSVSGMTMLRPKPFARTSYKFLLSTSICIFIPSFHTSLSGEVPGIFPSWTPSLVSLIYLFPSLLPPGSIDHSLFLHLSRDFSHHSLLVLCLQLCVCIFSILIFLMFFHHVWWENIFSFIFWFLYTLWSFFHLISKGILCLFLQRRDVIQ